LHRFKVKYKRIGQIGIGRLVPVSSTFDYNYKT
jgi:hypothetical protein